MSWEIYLKLFCCGENEFAVSKFRSLLQKYRNNWSQTTNPSSFCRDFWSSLKAAALLHPSKNQIYSTKFYSKRPTNNLSMVKKWGFLLSIGSVGPVPNDCNKVDMAGHCCNCGFYRRGRWLPRVFCSFHTKEHNEQGKNCWFTSR